MTIKKIEDLKKCQIICRYIEQVENCLDYLKQLGFKVEKYQEKPDYLIIYYSPNGNFFSNYNGLACLKAEFYNKKLRKTLEKLIKQKEEKEKMKDFEVASDGRIIKINNYESEKEVFIVCDYEYRKEGYKITNLSSYFLDFILKYELAYETEEARDKAMFKLEIETKLKNIAERLNAGRKIDWEDCNQIKFNIYYSYDYKALKYCNSSWCKDQGAIYCLDINFLKVAEKEIGEENLIKYFKEE